MSAMPPPAGPGAIDSPGDGHGDSPAAQALAALPPDDRAAQAKREAELSAAVDAAIEAINKKHGAQTINFGMIPELRGSAIGTKIAFSRIPDKAEFEE